MPDRPCACEGHTLDRMIQPTVLAILAAGPVHGYALVEQLQVSPLMRGSRPNDTGVYRLLAGLERQGLVSSRCADSKLGPRKRVFQLTRSGRVCLKKWLVTLDAYRRDLEQLTCIMRERAAAVLQRATDLS